MRVPRAALPRTEYTVKGFLSELVETDGRLRKSPHAADVRILRLFWPERVEWCGDAQASGWWAPGFSPFGNASQALELARHVLRTPRVAVTTSGDEFECMIFCEALQVGVRAIDRSVEYAVCRAVLHSWLLANGAMSGYALGLGLTTPGFRSPHIGLEEIALHHRHGDVLRGGLGRYPEGSAPDPAEPVLPD